jgi:hypothetical protein
MSETDAVYAEDVSATIRLGIFNSVEQTRVAVNSLLAAGFTREQISVICSDESKERNFEEFDHQHGPSDQFSAADLGSKIGSTLGGMVVVATAFASGGVPLLASEGPAAWTGGLAGGFIGSLVGRGVQDELARFYDHAVTQGKLLVAVEDHSDDFQDRLAQAARILAESGAETVALPHVP